MNYSNININLKDGLITAETNAGDVVYPIGSPEAFSLISKVMLRSGWDNKYVYSFSWLGRPIIQLPDDMIRIQEVIYQIQPDVIIETGVAHGGSLVFYASILNAIGKGRVVGVDIEIRPHNRKAIEQHKLYESITLVEGSSTDATTINKVKSLVSPGERVMVFLDSNHTKEHVLNELESYAELISVGSYIVAMDGIMQDLVGAPRASGDWATNNPVQAAKEFVQKNDNYIIEEPCFPFNEGNIIKQELTYWPCAYIKRVR